MPTTKKLNLYQRILAARATVPAVEKDGTNTHQKYEYVSHDRAAKVIGDALSEQGVLVVISQDKLEASAVEGLIFARCLITLINSEDPEETVQGYFWGASRAHDKAPHIALSLAKKAGLLALLMVPTGEPDYWEGENGEAPKNQYAPAKKATAKKMKAPASKKQDEEPPEPGSYEEDGDDREEEAVSVDVAKHEAKAANMELGGEDKEFSYYIPFDLKDQLKPEVRANDGRWQGDSKTWGFDEEQDWLEEVPGVSRIIDRVPF